ncbi:iron uptake transporter deferrochelatase/peroxidase subunit [Amycolatopsis sp. NPDC005232]|uniref:iron uptake transporter deferrochelatase/peroxidase subunit n=1 Tax=Amycolatopsis sp. NPDC005232 TaxID=3157027 RepID=UPI0033B2E2F1
MSLSRRRFLQGAGAGVTGSALAGGLFAAGARADTPPAAQGDGAVAFHGANQAGVLTPAPPAGTFAAFDVTTADRAGLMALLQALTTRARVLTAGGPQPDLGVGSPPADSAVLGPDMPADGLTVTVSVGPSLFDSRFGLAERRPVHLSTMPAFPDDALDPAWCHGDLLLQICAATADIAHHALRDLMKHTRAWMQPRYRIDGFVPPPRPSGAPRNLMGFKDGIVNPAPADAGPVVWVAAGRGEPAWATGGSYQVVRLIRMLIEFWDRVSLTEQERMFGRRRDTGAPLDGSAETDVPDYHRDPDGAIIPTDSHIRLANPRTSESAGSALLRRPYSYDRGFAPTGELDSGLIFCCYQQNLVSQFEAVQHRLAGEPLADYLRPFGGGYYFTLPGVRDDHDWYGSALLS